MTSNSEFLGAARGSALAANVPAGSEVQITDSPQPADPHSKPSGGQIWARRLSILVLVLFCLELGLVLAVLPWTRFWTANNFLLNYPSLRAFVANTFVRGAFTGLGLIDIWIGIWEATHYREKST